MDCLRMNTYHIDFDAEQKKIGQCVSDVLTIKNVRRATAYISDKRTIKATLQRRIDKRAKQATVLVTVGAPNFVERRFIRICKKDGMCFPLNQISWQYWPAKKK